MTVLANVKVLSPLPGDAWSDAFLAQAPGHAKLVLRTLKAEAAADPERVERFLEGARALANLKHGAVVQVFDAGKTNDGKVYVLTAHVEGETLAMRSQLPLEQLVDVGVPLAEALGAAHSLGLVHGALSPARVLLTKGGAQLDFSLAPLLREESADAAGDVRTLVAMLQAHDTSLKQSLQGLPDARSVRDRLKTLKGPRTDVSDIARTVLADGGPPTQPSAKPERAGGEAFVESVQIDDPDLTGKSIGSYTLEKTIGEGAMGRVYRGRHTRIGRQAAIKVLKLEHARSRELVQRFIQEATAVNAIKNDHIVEIYDFGEEALPDGTSRVYCVMELLEGTALADEMWKAPLKVERAVRIAQQMAKGLSAAHAVGVVHRDIKPDNIFLAKQGKEDFVKVLDFGVAKLLEQIGDLPRAKTAQGIVIGTPEYMAPEQAMGLPTDLRSDVYALGLVLYEMLAGVAPFQADTFAKLVAHITTKPPPPLPVKSRSGEHLPYALADVVLKCLQKRPEERYASCEELHQALEPFAGRTPPVDLTPAPATDVAAIEAMKPKTGRNVLLGVLVLLALSGVAFVALRPSAEPAPVAPPVVDTPKGPEQIVMEIQSSPTGAKVTREDTGEVLGTTPLEVKLEKREGMVTFRFELEGRQTLQRAVSQSRNNALSVDLAVVEKVEPPPVKTKNKRR
ncbi:MAG: protein kinase [Myxococcaceae bacterium]|nr:protein kinase [Myxococcaceae bacterium]